MEERSLLYTYARQWQCYILVCINNRRLIIFICGRLLNPIRMVLQQVTRERINVYLHGEGIDMT